MYAMGMVHRRHPTAALATFSLCVGGVAMCMIVGSLASSRSSTGTMCVVVIVIPKHANSRCPSNRACMSTVVVV
ncbi:hypothetical protein EDC04DRAFT_2706370 [Pisolithus marmoratus]|nr:hypothetical protein EDC04DRAFT_2706370 [Pisolithus marmoratus]